MNNNGYATIEHLLWMYELSLSIGRSLDLKTDCDGFLKTLMSRKNLTYAAVWIKNRYLPDEADKDWATLVYAHPMARAGEKRIPVNHPVFSLLEGKEVLLASSSEDTFAQVARGKGITTGGMILFALGDLGVLKLFFPVKLSEEEINQLKTLIPKFTTSIEGCLAYQQTLKELAERKQMEDELKRHRDHLEELVRERTETLAKSEEEFRLAFETAKDALFWADPQTGLITKCNKAAELLLERSREEIIGFPQTMVHPPEKAEMYANMFRKHIEHKGWAEDEAEVITKSGKIKPVAITATVTLIRGNPIIQGIFRDITERKQLEATLMKAEKLAAVSQIAAEAAHEVKNPLTVIKSGLYYLKKILPESELELKTISQMDDATERATTYINDLLNFSKPPVLALKSVDVHKVIDEALDELPQEILAGIELKKDFAPDVPLLNADPDRLRQVFTNLIKNAAEAIKKESGVSGQGAERIEIRSESVGELVQVSISDTGKGIAEGDIQRIFDPFFTTKGKGTGLGLAICQHIVEAHQGGIEVRSEVEKGTTFVVKLRG